MKQTNDVTSGCSGHQFGAISSDSAGADNTIPSIYEYLVPRSTSVLISDLRNPASRSPQREEILATLRIVLDIIEDDAREGRLRSSRNDQDVKVPSTQ